LTRYTCEKKGRGEDEVVSQTLIVTGGAGFIGSNFVRLALSHTDHRLIVLDKLTYAGNLANIEDLVDERHLYFVEGDIADRRLVERLFRDYKPSAVVNFAAESHVDRSIDSPQTFVETNVLGTFVLLDVARMYCGELSTDQEKAFRFYQISTDEVYGSLGETGSFSETTPVAPNSPYSASKASADHFVRAYHQTYGLPTVSTNCSNNYGPYQFPEKLIPLMILNALEGKSLPIYGDGGNIRDWLYVEDHCFGILRVLHDGIVGETYNLGGECERTNLQIVDAVCEIMEEFVPAAENRALSEKAIGSYKGLKMFVEDRPGHDRRYAIDSSKVQCELGWKPRNDLEAGLRLTVGWYLDNLDWCSRVQSGVYRRERLGLSADREED
jgi:dTDP-glucose 4,6-dehydratase